MDIKKLIIAVVIVAILAGSYYYWKGKQEKKEEEVKIEPAKISVDPVKQSTPVTPPVTKSTTPPPKPSPTFVGRTFKSRGKNLFDKYTIQGVIGDAKQSDGTYKRTTTNKYIKSSAPQVIFADAQLIGLASQATGSGFFINIGNGEYVWANKDLLIA